MYSGWSNGCGALARCAIAGFRRTPRVRSRPWRWPTSTLPEGAYWDRCARRGLKGAECLQRTGSAGRHSAAFHAIWHSNGSCDGLTLLDQHCPKAAKLLTNPQLREYVQGQARSMMLTVVRLPGLDRHRSRVATSHIAVTVNGSMAGRPNRLPTGCSSTSRMTSPCVSHKKPSTRPSTFKVEVLSSASWSVDSLSVDERPAPAQVFCCLLAGCEERRVHLPKGCVVETLHGAGQ